MFAHYPIKSRVGRYLAFPLLATLVFANEPSNEEVLAEIRALQARLAQLEALVARESGAVAPAAPVAPAPPTATPAAPAAAAAPASVVRMADGWSARVYGYVKLDAIYESQDTYTDAIPFWVQPRNGAESNRDGEFSFTAKESRLGIDLKGPQARGGDLSAKFEFDFYGNTALSAHHAYTPRTRHLYLQWASPDWTVLAGKTWETYLIAFPRTLNFTAYNLAGQLGLRRTQLRVSRTLALDSGDRLSFHAALAEPLGGVHGADLDGDGQDDGADAGLPFFEGKVTYQSDALFGQRATLGLAGFYGQEKVDSADLEGAGTFESWALIAGGEITLGGQFSLRGSIWTGANLDNAWGGIAQGINPTLGREISGHGGWVQLGYQATEALQFNLGYSLDDPQNDDLATGARSSNQTFLLNSTYSFSRHLLVGLEYLHLQTAYKGRPTEEADRVQSSVKLSF